MDAIIIFGGRDQGAGVARTRTSQTSETEQLPGAILRLEGLIRYYTPQSLVPVPKFGRNGLLGLFIHSLLLSRLSDVKPKQELFQGLNTRVARYWIQRGPKIHEL